MALVADLIAEFRRIVSDERASNYRYSDEDVRKLMNSAIKLAISLTPDITAVTQNVLLVAGVRQVKPGVHPRNFKVVRNRGAAGATAGKAVTPVSLYLMNRVTPEWMSGPTAQEVQNYAEDNADPQAFYVYPPSTGGQYVEVVYDQIPSTIDDTTVTVPINDRFAHALPFGMAATAYTADSDDPTNATQRQYFMAEFMARLGVQGGT